MSRITVHVADLTHTTNGISAQTFPLGAAYVTAYAQRQLGETFQFKLFRFPEHLTDAIVQDSPVVIAFSNYSWNFELAYRIGQWAKERNPNLIIVFGGPNFPVAECEQTAFLKSRPDMDFYIKNEGELGFVDLLTGLKKFDFDARSFKEAEESPTNCSYLAGDKLICGTLQRITDLHDLPSPYLTGIMDEFFDHPLMPMLETTRGCPFSCTFCTDGIASKNKIVRFDHDRVKAELSYISDRINGVDDLIITDLNFGMYKQDILTVQEIAKLQLHKNWPIVVSASMGKNKPERVIEAATILNGTWKIGASVQSWDSEVLANIERSNISLDAYRQFIDFVNGQGPQAEPYTELILGLPGDSLVKHFQSLRQGIESGNKNIRIHQAILLHGTSMASPATRRRFDIRSKFRVIPGCAGVYRFGIDNVPVAEFEEIITQTKDLPFEDYVSCRKMDLLVETFFNRGMFEEIFDFTTELGIPVFDILEYLHSHDDLYPDSIKTIFAGFVRETREDLFESLEDARAITMTSGSLERYLAGETAKNELLEYRAALYLKLAETTDLLVLAATHLLKATGKWKPAYGRLLDNLARYIVLRKQDIRSFDSVFEHDFDYDFTELQKEGASRDLIRLPVGRDKVPLRFFHDDDQKSHIRNVGRLNEHNAIGLGKMLQFNNLRVMFRTIERVVVSS